MTYSNYVDMLVKELTGFNCDILAEEIEEAVMDSGLYITSDERIFDREEVQKIAEKVIGGK